MDYTGVLHANLNDVPKTNTQGFLLVQTRSHIARESTQSHALVNHGSSPHMSEGDVEGYPAFSVRVAILVMAIAATTNSIKGYSGFGGGILFVSFCKFAATMGLFYEEGTEKGLGGMAGTLSLVTVMEVVTTLPLAFYERHNVHWPICSSLSVGSLCELHTLSNPL